MTETTRQHPMPRPATPSEVIGQLSRCLTAGDVPAALALYEPEAAFLPQPGQRIHGLDAIREALEGFTALRPTLTGEIEQVIEAGGTALVANRWTLDGTRPDDGSAVHFGGLSADVLRRRGDGTWGILIDNPWG